MPQEGLLLILFRVVDAGIGLLIALLLVYAILSMLIAFQMVSARNPAVGAIWQFTQRVSAPLLQPFRALIPPVSGIDFSVMIVIFLLAYLVRPLWWWIYAILT